VTTPRRAPARLEPCPKLVSSSWLRTVCLHCGAHGQPRGKRADNLEHYKSANGFLDQAAMRRPVALRQVKHEMLLPGSASRHLANFSSAQLAVIVGLVAGSERVQSFPRRSEGCRFQRPRLGSMVAAAPPGVRAR
jgi:hypothetical protein